MQESMVVFSRTKGAGLKAQKKGASTVAFSKHDKTSLIKEIEGKTEIATKIAEELKNGNIGLNILSDHLFEAYLGAEPNVIAEQVGKHIYLRKSSASIVSDLVHEGNHAYEFISGVNPREILTWPGEIRAYKAEREFQIKTKRRVDFPNEDDLLVHVWKNYDKE